MGRDPRPCQSRRRLSIDPAQPRPRPELRLLSTGTTIHGSERLAHKGMKQQQIA